MKRRVWLILFKLAESARKNRQITEKVKKSGESPTWSHYGGCPALSCMEQRPLGIVAEMRSDADFVQAVLASDCRAFDEVTRRYQRAACAAAWSVLHDRHAAEDAAWEGFLTAYTRLGGLREPAAFGAWLLRIVRQKALR